MTMYLDRAAWSARPAKDGTTPRELAAITSVVIHFADVAARSSLPDEEAAVLAIQGWHMDHNGWLDIGYHAIVGMTGNVYAGRPPNIVGAHCEGFNTPSLGLCFLTADGFPPVAGAAAVDAINLWQWVLHRKLDVFEHREKTSTNCPDDRIAAWVDAVRRPGGPLR